MSLPIIPGWTDGGVLPPINSHDGSSFKRSPYITPLTEFISRFSTTEKRIKILDGFLRYRAKLHSAGLVCGFQWLNGSFSENVDDLKGGRPRDIDVVTFFELTSEQNLGDIQTLNPELYDKTRIKDDLLVDSYFVQMAADEMNFLVRMTTYWYSMWSHRKDSAWKGYIQVDLSPSEDDVARHILDATKFKGV